MIYSPDGRSAPLVALLALLALPCLVACGPEPADEQPPENSGFTLLDAGRTGLDFSNDLVETAEFNRLTYEYFYNGGGIAAGDLDGDGLVDLYFTGNQAPDRLYRNLGGLRFEDVTERAGLLRAADWHAGVAMADVNGDGMLDIYVCRSGPATLPRANLLYINEGDWHFEERAAEYGLAIEDSSVQAVFFDPDRDGDLDIYLLNHPQQPPLIQDAAAYRQDVLNGHLRTDMFLRNEGGLFVDRTLESGFQNYGYRHGAGVADLDHDGWPDLYVSSDFDDPDHLFMNRGDGTFRDDIGRMAHISMFSMGNDLADFNNDGWTDVFVADMTPADHVRSKTNMASMNPAKFNHLVEHGFHYQFMINTLQLNQGDGSFSEIAQLAGVDKTDWSWAILLTDLDNDGHKDLFVTNGIRRDVLNNDVRGQAAQAMAQQGGRVNAMEILAMMPQSKLKNRLFRNTGELRFEDVSESWVEDRAFNSNGAVYADLDNDGDQDLVVNNVDEKALVYRNDHRGNHYLQLSFEGESGNPFGIGVKAFVHAGGQLQYQELYPVRGYLSSVPYRLHFGLGKSEMVDKLVIVWPDGSVQTQTAVSSDQRLRLYRKNAGPGDSGFPPNEHRYFKRLQGGAAGLSYTHRENRHDDFAMERLLPHSQSMNGPGLAAADVNGDGWDDLYVGGAAGQAAALFVSGPGGAYTLSSQPDIEADKASEDLGSLFFDADGDGDADLYVVSGGNEFPEGSPSLRDRLYLNDGSGRFKRSADALPDLRESGSRVRAADIDGDGDLDLFVGGRLVPGRYPLPASSSILVNQGGRFQDATAAIAPGLAKLGLVTDAAFSDADGDGDLDLWVVGEWLPVCLFENRNGRFERVPDPGASGPSEGWWFSIRTADLNRDGRDDLILGNLGLNNKFHPTEDHPLHVYYGDFDGNGTADLVLSEEIDDRLVPVRGRECSSQQVPFIKEKFGTFQGFAEASLQEIYGEELEDALHLQAFTFASEVWVSTAAGRYERRALPVEAQIAPIMDMLIEDIDGDGLSDLICVGNLYGAEVETVRYDAGHGCVLLGKGDGSFESLPARRSGLSVQGNAKSIARLVVPGGNRWIVTAVSNGPLQAFELVGKGP